MEISAKMTNKFQSLIIVSQKAPSEKSGWAPNTCYKIVVRRFFVYKLKQKMTKAVKHLKQKIP